ncbi:S1 family peptidase [Streptomyces marincola]|uniref:S1 family peptidase n=1 Tax=Streptomyces marincola TaxID=2878388 RepID=UPI0026D5AE97
MIRHLFSLLRTGAGRGGRAGALVVGLLASVGLLAPAAAGAEPRAAFSAAELAAAHDAVRAAGVPGTAWGLDPAAGTVRVTADATVTGSELDHVLRTAGPLAGALDIERVPGRFQPHLQGGDPVYAPGGQRCTAGFNVTSGSADFFVTAGHCTAGHPTWYADPGLTVPVGTTAGSSFPGNDYGVVRYTNPAVPRPGSVNCDGTSVDITGPADGTIGGRVQVAAPTGCRAGTILALNQSVNFGGNIVSGLGRVNVCTQPGDSGAPVFAGSRALGVVSGGIGDCAAGGVTFYQPIGEVLGAYGLTLL